MTRDKRIRMWLLGASILAYGCSGTSGNGDLVGKGSGGLGGGGLGGDGTTGGASGSGGDGSGSSAPGGNGTATPGSGTAVPGGGARETPLMSVQQAVLTDNNCNAKPGASACTSCVLRSCCAETQACTDRHNCVTLGGCMATCNDESCIGACARQYDLGVNYFQDLLNCASTSCTASCPAE
jgi:hypothetical protein